jgi:putative transcriptional regulator
VQRDDVRRVIEAMGPRKRVLHSPDPLDLTSDPLDQESDPQDQFEDPLDQPNANGHLRASAGCDVSRYASREAPHDVSREVPHEAPRLERAHYAAIDVRAMRVKMNITQRQFAAWFGFPVATLRHWERGNRRPAGTALVLLNVIRENPRAVMNAVRKARARNAGIFPVIEPLGSFRAPPGFGNRPKLRRPRGPRRR